MGRPPGKSPSPLISRLSPLFHRPPTSGRMHGFVPRILGAPPRLFTDPSIGMLDGSSAHLLVSSWETDLFLDLFFPSRTLLSRRPHTIVHVAGLGFSALISIFIFSPPLPGLVLFLEPPNKLLLVPPSRVGFFLSPSQAVLRESRRIPDFQDNK